MKTMKLYVGLLLSGMLASSQGFAQETTLTSAATPVTTSATTPEEEKKKEEEKTLTISGSIDTYFRTTLGSRNGLTGTYGPSTSFADLKGFGLGMANIIASYGGEKTGFVADLVFGPRGKAAVFGTASGQAIVNQMYAYYKLSNKVTLNMGQFNTFVGYEVISPTANFHYSTSYLFSWGPFNHTGLRADFDFGNGVVGKLAVMNPTDIVEFNPVNTYTLGAQIGKTSDAGGIWLNILYGDQDGTLDSKDDPYEYDEDGNIVGFLSSAGSLFQIDLTTGWNLSDKFYIGLNTSHQTIAAGEQFVAEGEIENSDGDAVSFTGFAVYPKITLSETFALGLRAEHFAVKKGHLAGIIAQDADGDGSVTEFTLTGNYKTGALTIIPELRLDSTSEDTYLDADNKPANNMMSFAVAAVYKF